MQNKILNVGILAHVDAGKTTLTENLLFTSGALKNLGSVDDGTTQTDSLNVEKQRGISVQSAHTSYFWKNTQVNIVDTPGHVDFSAEVERTLQILDVAVLVISAADGIQAHTETLWRALAEQQIPVIIFINKIDRVGADVEQVLGNITKEFTENTAIFHEVNNEGSADANITRLWGEDAVNESIVEVLANVDDAVLEKFLEGESMQYTFLQKALKNAFQKAKLIPVLAGSAKNSVGIDDLQDFLTTYFSNEQSTDQHNFQAVIFGISQSEKQGRVNHVKILQGALKPRDTVWNATQNIEEKVTFIKKHIGNKLIDIESAVSDDIVDVYGLSETAVGDFLGAKPKAERKMARLQAPLLTVQVKPVNDADFVKLAEALQLLDLERPWLGFEWLKDEKELHVKVMGWIQMEVLESILKDRFQVEAKFENPTVIYKETPLAECVGEERYTMPKPCWAVVKFRIEPGEPGSGIVYKSKTSVDKIHQKYQNEVERTISEAVKQGIKGWEVADAKITLIDGEDHEIHSRPGDFIIATPMAIMNGLKDAGTQLLEPVLAYKITAPEDLLGKVTGDITQMRGSFDSPELENEKFVLKGLLPLATSLDYPVKLSSRSGGKAKIAIRLHSYQPCNDEQGKIRPYKGISPLDRSKYILKARKAIQ